MSKYIEDGLNDGGPVAAINVTSLVDVMFCLLIMFMVSTPLMTPKEDVDLVVPKAKANVIEEAEFELSVISVDAKGQVFMGSTPLSPEPDKMASELSANEKLKTDGRAFIQGDINVPYEKVLDVLVALRKAGVEKIGFITDPNFKKGT